MNKDVWTDRQVMLGESSFEFYHYLDADPRWNSTSIPSTSCSSSWTAT